MSVLFSVKNAICSEYCGWRDAQNPIAISFRAFAEDLWGQYEPFADANFLDEASRDFQTRYWEMYLTCTLLENASKFGYGVTCPKPGPDNLLSFSGRKVWIEAITASDGDPSKPDSVLACPENVAREVPDEKIILRYTTAIQEKFKKYAGYVRSRIINPNEPYVIAINAGKLTHRWMDAEMPRFLKALFPIGHAQLILDARTTAVVDRRHKYRPEVSKVNGSPVSTRAFLDPQFVGISAVLHSYVTPYAAQASMGLDFIIAHNPLAANPIAKAALPCSREYWVSLEVNGLGKLHRDDHT
jgi:hypothetical protein